MSVKIIGILILIEESGEKFLCASGNITKLQGRCILLV